MTHMIKETYHGPAIEFDSASGSCYVPWDILTSTEKAAAKRCHFAGENMIPEDVELLRKYSEEFGAFYSIKLGSTMMTRETAPGYLDCTPWSPIRFAVYKKNKTVETLR